jgi:large subunit ribosomal protein L25
LIDLDHNETLLNLQQGSFPLFGTDAQHRRRRRKRRPAGLAAHPWKPLILHCDFQRVDAGHAIHQRVPLHFINADIAPGVKISGGNVSHAHNDIEVSCLPQDLPAFIEVDLKDLEVRPLDPRSELVFPAGCHAGHCTVTIMSWCRSRPRRRRRADEAAGEAPPA